MRLNEREVGGDGSSLQFKRPENILPLAWIFVFAVVFPAATADHPSLPQVLRLNTELEQIKTAVTS